MDRLVRCLYGLNVCLGYKYNHFLINMLLMDIQTPY